MRKKSKQIGRLLIANWYYMRFLGSALSLLLATRCACGAGTAEPGPKEPLACPAPAASTCTADMAALLKDVRERALAEMRDEFRNSEKAEYFAQMAAQAPTPQARLQALFECARMLVNAERTTDAIPLAEEFVARMDRGEFQLRPEQRAELLHHLAICNLRLGEQTNCQQGHTSASRIVPIASEGRHHDPAGSRRAAGAYTRILEEYPDDLTARWLLNVASMTLGEHPAGVPQKWLIPAKALGPAGGFPRFTDIAAPLGIDRPGPFSTARRYLRTHGTWRIVRMDHAIGKTIIPSKAEKQEGGPDGPPSSF